MLRHDFINYDDDKYVTRNDHLRIGTWQSIRWAFTSFYAANWHPLTWASHLLDIRLFGLKPMGHHLTNMVLHLLNVLLLFLAFSWMTGSASKSGFVAALFALHPLHIESVAWVAERKDVLSTMFWMLTLLAYIGYAKNPGAGRYALVVILFAIGLMAKPMLVTLPFVLLLLDFWPLSKTIRQFPINPKIKTASKRKGKGYNWGLIWEKTPLFILSLASSIITCLAQARGRSLGTLEMLPPGIRIANATVSYATYLWKTIWPRNLAVFYPHPKDTLPEWVVLGSIAILASVSYFVYRFAKSGHPYLALGWLWYIGTLIPVIGLVQVGAQAMADRYTYIPLIGIFIILAWGIPDLVGCAKTGCQPPTLNGKRQVTSSKIPLCILPFTAIIVIAVFAVCTYIQLGYWKNSFTLFRRSLAVIESDVAHNNLGLALADQKKISEAIKHYAAALRIHPDSIEAQGNIANALSSTGRIEDAIKGYRQILELRPDDHKAHNNLANALMKLGKLDEAIQHYYAAIELTPNNPIVHYNLSTALFAKGDYAGAWQEVCIARSLGFQGDSNYIKNIKEKLNIK